MYDEFIFRISNFCKQIQTKHKNYANNQHFKQLMFCYRIWHVRRDESHKLKIDNNNNIDSIITVKRQINKPRYL